MDFNANTYSATSQLVADAIEYSEQHDETVEIRTPDHRREGVEEELFVACEGHDDCGTFWGESWKIRLIFPSVSADDQDAPEVEAADYERDREIDEELEGRE